MKKRTAIVLGAVGLVAVAIAVGSNGSKSDTTASDTTPGSHTVQAAAPAVAKSPTVVLTTSGHGIKNTANFTTGPEWSVDYTFDCSGFGSKGNFILSVGSGLGDTLANALDASGADTSYEHHNPGTHYLSVNSECSWTLKVTDAG